MARSRVSFFRTLPEEKMNQLDWQTSHKDPSIYFFLIINVLLVSRRGEKVDDDDFSLSRHWVRPRVCLYLARN